MNNNPRKFIFVTLGIVFFGFVVFFGYSRFGRYIEGPKIISSNIPHFYETDSGAIEFSAVLENTRIISIGQREIAINQNQEIQDRIIVPPGYSVVHVDLEDHFGKKQKYTYTIYNRETPYLYAPTLEEAVLLESNQETETETEETQDTLELIN